MGGVEGFALTTGLQCESSSYRRTALCACHMCVRCTRKSTADVYCDGLCGFVARAKPTCRRVSSARASSRAQSGAPSQGSASSAQASEASLTWNMPPHRVPGSKVSCCATFYSAQPDGNISVPSRGLTSTTRRRITRRRKRTRSRWHGLHQCRSSRKECEHSLFSLIPPSRQGWVGLKSTEYDMKLDICQQDGIGIPLRDSRKTPISAHASAILVCAPSNPCTRHGSLRYATALISGFLMTSV